MFFHTRVIQTPHTISCIRLDIPLTHILPPFMSTVHIKGGKLIAVSGVSGFNPLIPSYDIHGRKGEVIFLPSKNTWI
jgi:hypothetical protein